MFEELIGKQICCYKNNKLDNTAMSCLRIMYPLFKVVSTEFDIYPGEPFIYTGDIKWVHKIQKYKEPHIIVASTGEYDLTNRATLMQLAFMKHKKQVPKYLDATDGGIDLEKDWDLYTFMLNWKYVWLLGTPLDKVKEQNKTFFTLLDSLSSPVKLIAEFSNAMSTYGEDTFKYLEYTMISFIYKCKDMTVENTKSQKMLEIRSKFINSFSGNIHNAVWNLTHSTIDYQPLRFLNFLLDLTWPDRSKITNDRR